MEAWKQEADFEARVLADPEIRAFLSAAEIADVFRLDRYLEHVEALFQRVFGDGNITRNAALERGGRT
jgi:adenylosuccinate lyase